MKTKLKAIVAIMLTLFLMTTLFYGVLVKAPPEPIKIGVIGPKGMIQWDGIWEGAQMARDEINNAGGILGHNITLYDIDSHGAPPHDASAGWTETETALEDGVQFLVGGFRTEVVGPIRDHVMDYAEENGRPIWFIAGASTDNLIDCGYFPGHPFDCGACVRDNYTRYRYMFRVTPMNSTILFKQFAAFLSTYMLPTRLAEMYCNATTGPVKTYLVIEDLSWADLMVAALAGSTWVPFLDPPFNTIPNPYPSPPHAGAVLGLNATVIGIIRPAYPPAPAPDWGTIFSTIEAAQARLIVHIFSAYLGGQFIENWGELEVNALPVGINVDSQMQEFWDDVGGDCEYESFLATVGTATPIIPGVTDKFWNDYKARWGHYPIYTAWGAYDAIMALNETITAIGTWPLTCDQLIPHIEKTNRQSLTGQFKYTGPQVINMTAYTGYPWYLVAPFIHSGASTPQDALSAAKTVYATYFDPGGVNPDMKGTLHDVYCNIYSLTKYWPPPNNVRAMIVQWQTSSPGEMKVVWPQDQSYSRKFQIPPWMYELADVDVNYDGFVGGRDMGVPGRAFGAYPGLPSWNIEADIKGDGFIDGRDLGAIGRKFGQAAPQWPLP